MRQPYESPYASEWNPQMSMRDYFAALAMQSLIAIRPQMDNSIKSDLALEAYVYAEQMLKARDAK
jgi:hypothetical protein